MDTPPTADVPSTEVSCGVVVRLEGFGALRPEYCASDADRRIPDAGSDASSAAPRPPDAGLVEDGSLGLLPPLRDSSTESDASMSDTGSSDTGTPEPPCELNCALACRDVVVSNAGRYSRFWMGGTCARDGSRVSCVMSVNCP